MTQTELGEYMKDLQNEIEDELKNTDVIKSSENANGYGYHLYVAKKQSIITPKLLSVIIQRIELIFEMDFEIEFISGWVGRVGDRYHVWKNFKRRLSLPTHAFELSIGKLQRSKTKIKRFNL